MTTAVAVSSARDLALPVGRAIGWALVLLALTAFGYEMLLAAQSGAWRMIATGELWYALDVGSLNLVQAVVQRYVHPWVWDPVIQTALTWPAWSLFGAPGIALLTALPKKETVDAD